MSAGVFHKSVADFVFNERTRLDAGPFADFDEARRVNGEGGSVTGFESTWAPRLTRGPLQARGSLMATYYGRQLNFGLRYDLR